MFEEVGGMERGIQKTFLLPPTRGTVLLQPLMTPVRAISLLMKLGPPSIMIQCTCPYLSISRMAPMGLLWISLPALAALRDLFSFVRIPDGRIRIFGCPPVRRRSREYYTAAA